MQGAVGFLICTNMHLTADLPRNLPVKKISKPIRVWQNYGHESVDPLFGPPCIVHQNAIFIQEIEKFSGEGAQL